MASNDPDFETKAVHVIGLFSVRSTHAYFAWTKARYSAAGSSAPASPLPSRTRRELLTSSCG